MKEYEDKLKVPPYPQLKLLTTKEAAEAWGISEWTLRRMVKDGRMRPIVGIDSKWRWKVTDLDEANVLVRL